MDFTGTTDDPDSVKYPALAAGLAPASIDFSTPENLVTAAESLTTPGSLADYMGFPVGFGIPFGKVSTPPSFNMIKMLGYLDVVYNYYINQQIDSIPTAAWNLAEDGEGASQTSFLVSDIEALLRAVKTAADPVVALSSFIESKYLGSWAWLNSRSSIFQRCLPPYYLESWLKTSGYVDAEIKVDLEADNKTISMRNISAMSHIQRWIDLALNGGRWSDFLNSEFDVSRVKNHSTPIFLGADRQYLGSNVIYQTTGAGDSSSPLGAFAGQSSGGEQFRRRVFNFDEPGYFMVMASLVPDVIYSRGLDPFLEELNLGDSYAPALDNITMEPLLLQTLDAIPQGSADSPDVFSFASTNYGNGIGVGFVPAWSKLMQLVSRSHGRLTTELSYWLLNRDYGDEVNSSQVDSLRGTIANYLKDGSITYEVAETILAVLQRSRPFTDYSPYIRSDAYNSVFADISNEAQNFVLTFSCSASAYREKSKVNVATTL